jgi:hypothetical protein
MSVAEKQLKGQPERERNYEHSSNTTGATDNTKKLVSLPIGKIVQTVCYKLLETTKSKRYRKL